MLHLNRTGKNLFRFVLILLLVQFLVPTFVQASTQDSDVQRKTTVTTHHDAGISVSVFLKENTEEENESTEEIQVDLEILDFSNLSTALTLSHTSFQWCIINVKPTSERLFKLFCVFLI